MRELTINELDFISGGKDKDEKKKRKGVEYAEDESPGLKLEEAKDACGWVGRASDIGGMRNPYKFMPVTDLCNNGVDLNTRRTDKSIISVCEDAEGGKWNYEKRECEY